MDKYYTSVSFNESIAIKYALNEFLKRACEIANGDTRKSINIYKIWDEKFPIKGLERETALPIILRALQASNFARDGNNKDEIKLTLKGIYYVADNLKVPPENLGVLSRTDVKKLENLFLQSLYEQTKGDPARTMSIYEVEKKLGGVSGTARILQIAEYLKMKGLIEIDESKGQIKFRVPSEQVKKYYPPPSPPQGSFSSASFST
jgi:hypothetical protein